MICGSIRSPQISPYSQRRGAKSSCTLRGHGLSGRTLAVSRPSLVVARFSLCSPLARSLQELRNGMAVTWADLKIPDADFDIAALHSAMDARRTGRGMSWKAVAREVN